MMKRFPRSLIFVGDNPEVPLGRDYNSWIGEACSKFRELGMPCVFDASRLFYGWARAADLIHFRTSEETDHNVQSLIEAVLKLASNLFPWEWRAHQASLGRVIPEVEVPGFHEAEEYAAGDPKADTQVKKEPASEEEEESEREERSPSPDYGSAHSEGEGEEEEEPVPESKGGSAAGSVKGGAGSASGVSGSEVLVGKGRPLLASESGSARGALRRRARTPPRLPRPLSPLRERGSPGQTRKKGRQGDGAGGSEEALVLETLPKVNCPMGRRDRAPALAAKATYPSGSVAGDAVDEVLNFYGVDRGVLRDPAYHLPWEDTASREAHFNTSQGEPEGGMSKFSLTNDRHVLAEIKPAAGRKCFIANLKSARQCGYERCQRIYRIENVKHSEIFRVSRTLSSLGRHRAPVIKMPMSTGAWIQLGLVVEYCQRPAWFLIEIIRSSEKARFQLLSSCAADEDPENHSTMCQVEGYRVPRASRWIGCGWKGSTFVWGTLSRGITSPR